MRGPTLRIVGQDPYGEKGDFTPYQPGAPSGGEQPEPVGAPEAETPYVPYGGAASGAAATSYAPTTTPRRGRAWPWIIAVIVVVGLCGGGIAAIVSAIAGADVLSATSDDINANDLEDGQCLTGAGLDPTSSDPVSGLEEVACTEGHDAEVVAVNVLDSDEAAAYDFDDDNGAIESCRPYFTKDELHLLDVENLFLIALTESRTPATDDHVACLIVHADASPLHEPVSELVPGSVMPSS